VETIAIVLGFLMLAAVGVGVLLVALAALRVYERANQPVPVVEAPKPDTSEVYRPLNVEKPAGEDEGVRESRYAQPEHEIVAGLPLGLDYEEFIAREREIEMSMGKVVEKEH
jgi:hypothetical protein